MGTIHEVLARDRNRNILGPITRWSGGSLRMRFNRPASGSFDVHNDTPYLSEMLNGGGYILTRNDGINTPIVLASGPIINKVETDDGWNLEVTDDTAIIAKTNVLAVPSEYGPKFSEKFDVRTGVASTIMREYVSYNTGPDARPDRVRPGFALAADPLLGDVLTGRYARGPADELLRELALTGGGLRFYCEQFLGTSVIVFHITAPTNRSSEVTFDRTKGTLGRFEKRIDGSGPNVVFAGPQDGFGIERSVYEQIDPAAILLYGRNEVFVDVGEAASVSEIYQRIAEVLANTTEQTTLTVYPSEHVPWVYGRDYQLGDIVGTEFGPAVVREVDLILDGDNGLVAVPVIGTAGSSSDGFESRQISEVERRLNNIERNFGIPDKSLIFEMLHEQLQQMLPRIGTYRETSHITAAPGWLMCDGSAISRTIYAALWAHFQAMSLHTVFGLGDGSTTFNLPDRRSKYSRGAGAGGVTNGESGGSLAATGIAEGTAEITLPDHEHEHAHGLNGAIYTHKHAGGSHVHDHDHDLDPHVHDYDIDHDHPSTDTGGADTDSVAIGRDEPGSGAEDHHHVVDIPAYTANKTTEEGDKSAGGTFTSTQSADNVTPTAPYNTGYTDTTDDSWTGGTESDDTLGGGGLVIADVEVDVNLTIEPTFFGVNYEIYTGV